MTLKRNLVRAMVNSVAVTALVAPALLFAEAASVDAAPAFARGAAPKTKVTYLIPHCRGCTVTVGSYQDDGDGSPRFWDGPTRKVRAGEVSLRRMMRSRCVAPLPSASPPPASTNVPREAAPGRAGTV